MLRHCCFIHAGVMQPWQKAWNSVPSIVLELGEQGLRWRQRSPTTRVNKTMFNPGFTIPSISFLRSYFGPSAATFSYRSKTDLFLCDCSRQWTVGPKNCICGGGARYRRCDHGLLQNYRQRHPRNRGIFHS